MSCEGCSLAMADFSLIWNNEERLVEWLRAHGVLRRELSCEKCGTMCTLKKDFRFVCGKTITTRKAKTVKKVRCNFSVSLRRGTWFENANLSFQTICIFSMYWAVLRPPCSKIIERECAMSSHAVVDWSNFCRELCIQWCIRKKEKLGGVGKTVEIDEAKFGEPKYNQEKLCMGRWVIGGCERESKKMFIVSVAHLSADALLNAIKEWILPGTTIISDCWKTYNCLSDEGFQQLTVTQLFNFMDPTSGTDSQNIKRALRDVRASVHRYGKSEEIYQGYLCEYLWKRTLPDHRDRLHALFKDLISVVYDPHAPVPAVERVSTNTSEVLGSSEEPSNGCFAAGHTEDATMAVSSAAQRDMGISKDQKRQSQKPNLLPSPKTSKTLPTPVSSIAQQDMGISKDRKRHSQKPNLLPTPKTSKTLPTPQDIQ